MASFRYYPPTNAVLADTLSSSRFEVYVSTVGGLDVQGALDLYIWNLRLGSAFYGALAIFEVALRNALHRELTKLYGVSWFNDPAFVAMARQVIDPAPSPVRSPPVTSRPGPTDLLQDIEKVESRLIRDLTNRAGSIPAPDAKRTPTADDIVAALDFGYWTNLLNRDLDTVLYSRGLFKAFPCFRDRHGTAKNPARSEVAGPLNQIRKFRNRVMHLEPLFKSNVVAEFERLLDVTSWIEGDAARWINYHSSLGELFRDRDRPRHKF